MQSIRYISIVLEYLSKFPPPPLLLPKQAFLNLKKKKSFMTKGSRGVTGSLGPLRNQFFTQAVDSYYHRLKFGHECFLLSCSSPYRLVAHFFCVNKGTNLRLGVDKTQ